MASAASALPFDQRVAEYEGSRTGVREFLRAILPVVPSSDEDSPPSVGSPGAPPTTSSLSPTVSEPGVPAGAQVPGTPVSSRTGQLEGVRDEGSAMGSLKDDLARRQAAWAEIRRIATSDPRRERRRAARRFLKEGAELRSPGRVPMAPFLAVGSLACTLLIWYGGGNPIVGLVGGLLCGAGSVGLVNRFHPDTGMQSEGDNAGHDRYSS